MAISQVGRNQLLKKLYKFQIYIYVFINLLFFLFKNDNNKV